MATTDIKQFAGSGGANVLTQAEYESLTAILANGFQPGILPSTYLNKVLRQAMFLSAGVAAWIVSRNINVPDDGNLAALVTKIQAALDDAIGSATSGAVPSSRLINTTSPLSGGGDLSADRTLSIQDGTTLQKGAVQLTDATNSTSTTTAATPNSVKAAYDLANAASLAADTANSGVTTLDGRVDALELVGGSTESITLPGGVTIKTGNSITVNGSSVDAISFPVAFPTACTAMGGGLKGTGSEGSQSLFFSNLTASSFDVRVVDETNSGVSGADFYWWAIGN
jgi:hypothetical protein